MTARSHNKKRNVGIIFELLLRHVSDRLVEDDQKGAQKALNLIEKYFNKNTELYKEFRLFNALAKSTVSSTSVAAAILTEAKQASRRCNTSQLSREKSLLIREINHSLHDDKFYYRRVPDYTVYATIQTLINEWRSVDRSDLAKMVEYESKTVEWLLKEKQEGETAEQNTDVDALVVKIMSEKFNKKYTGRLNDEQKDIVRSYVFSIAEDNGKSIKDKLSLMRENTLSEMNTFLDTTDNKFILEKADVVRKIISRQNLENIDDSVISKMLVISRLKSEIEGGLNE
tara:strand:+ start:3078 stop:3932 length:855 start_codon:yes stop_codon:yes gene_type:complete